MIPYILAQDATHSHHAAIPPAVLACGYDTGSGGIAWTGADYAAHVLPFPAIHIDQDPAASDPTADVLDVEAMAATIAEIAGWIRRARASFNAGTRPGQRWPAVYLSMGNLDQAVTDLQAAGISDVPFWTAQPSLGLAAAITRVQSATGPYPCIGVQYAWGANVDYDVFSLDWVTKVSGGTVTTGTISQQHWNWCHKCQGLFYGPGKAKSICPAGGQHDNTGSGDYTLNDVTGAP